MANPSSNVFFPTELIDSVIDHSHSDRQTLMVCALVSKRWAPRSRHHIFSKITISHANAREFIQLLTSPHCTFSGAVQRLDVHFISGSQRWFSEFSRRLFRVDKTVITSLGITGTRNTIIREEAEKALLPFGEHVHNLVIGPVIFETFAEFAGILCSFKSLNSLSCECFYRVPDQPEDIIQYIAPLRHLHLSLPSAKPIFDFFFLQNDVLPTVTSLSLSLLTVQNDNLNLTNYMGTRNNILESFSTNIDSSFSGVSIEVFLQNFELNAFESLREVHFETNPHIPPEQVFVLLSSIPPSNLESIEITASLVHGIARIDVLLSGERFPSLKRLRLVGSNWADARQFLPRCDARQILKEM